MKGTIMYQQLCKKDVIWAFLSVLGGQFIFQKKVGHIVSRSLKFRSKRHYFCRSLSRIVCLEKIICTRYIYSIFFTTAAMIRKFEGKHIAGIYSKFRPRYPRVIAEKIVAYARKNNPNGKLQHLLDVGCGSGQSTEMFKPYFEKITGVDVSPNQILEAKKNPKSQINYLVSAAESLPLEDNTVDVVCVGTAAHWFDLAKFWIECRRVMREDGSLVLFGYGSDMDIVPARYVPNQREKKDMLSDTGMLLKKFLNDIGPLEQNAHIVNHYADIFDMIPSSSKFSDEITKITVHWSLERFHQYYLSISAYQDYLQKRLDDDCSPDLLQQLIDDIKKTYGLYGTKDDEILWKITFKVFMLFSGRPEPQS